jgi:hypothetical protein
MKALKDKIYYDFRFFDCKLDIEIKKDFLNNNYYEYIWEDNFITKFDMIRKGLINNVIISYC